MTGEGPRGGTLPLMVVRPLAVVLLLTSCGSSPEAEPTQPLDLSPPRSAVATATPSASPAPSVTPSATAIVTPSPAEQAKKCEATGDMVACTEAAFAYESGKGLPKDPKRAVELFAKFCDEEAGIYPQHCLGLASHLLDGTGAPKDAARAARIHAATCAQGVCDSEVLYSLCAEAGGAEKTNVGCVSLARVLTLPVVGAPSDPKQARSLMESACKRKEAEACRAVSEWYAEGWSWADGASVKKDPKRAASYLKQACDAGDKTACTTK